MNKMVQNQRQEIEEEHARGLALVAHANETNSAIRRRLAAVANDLRVAARSADNGENLLQLAQKFEQHARAGETQ